MTDIKTAMDSNTEEDAPSEDNEEGIKQEVERNFFLYFLLFLISYYASYIIPVILFMAFYLLFFGPYFLENHDFINLFIDIRSLIALLTLPLVILGCYLFRLFFMGLITRIFWSITEKISPTKDGIIPRNLASKTAKYYHLRSYMIKYPKNLFRKGIFPWLTNWLYNFVGVAKIGKGTTIEDQLGADRYLNVGKNCYIGVGGGISSHLVEGIFGNISYFEIKMGDNVTLGGHNLVGPGCELKDNSYLLPLAVTTKYNLLKGDNYYWGMPLRRIFRKKIMNYLKLSQEDLDKAEALRQKQVELKEIKNGKK